MHSLAVVGQPLLDGQAENLNVLRSMTTMMDVRRHQAFDVVQLSSLIDRRQVVSNLRREQVDGDAPEADPFG